MSRHIVSGTACAVLVLAGLVGIWQVSKARCFSLVGKAVCHVTTHQSLVALTFDDGPTDLGVRSILPQLKAHDDHATFFLIGSQLSKRPDLARAILVAGDEIGNHSYSHQRMVLHSSTFYDREITLTDAAIAHVGGRPGLFRPPNGKKLIGLPLALGRRGLIMVMWDVEDPPTTDPKAFAKIVVEQAEPGSIILLHAMYPGDAPARLALPVILDGLAGKGLHTVTVRALLAAGAAH